MGTGGMAGVYVSHDLAVVAQMADRIVVLRGGEIQEDGPTATILEAPAHPYTRELLAAFHPKPHATGPPAEAALLPPVLDVRNVTAGYGPRSEEHTSELQSRQSHVCRLLLEKKLLG